jgi:hypothetical protein
MRSSSVVVGAFVSLAAPLAGVAAYQSWSPSPAAVAMPAQRTVAATTTPATKVRLRPCEAGTRLRHGVCVSHQVRTVIAPVAPAPAPALPTSTPASSGPDDDWQTTEDDADEPTATPGEGDQDDDADEVQPTCAPDHQQGTNDRRCGDDDTADEQEQEGSEPGEDDEGEHEGDEGTGVGTGTDD